MDVQNIPRTEDDDRSAALLGAAARCSPGASATCPRDFLAELFGHAVAEDLVRYRAERARRHRRAVLVASLPSERRRAARSRFDAGRGCARRRRCSKSSTTTCRSWSIRCSANCTERGLDIRAPGPPGVHRRARRGRQRSSASKPRATADGAARKLHPHPCRGHARTQAQRAEIVRALEAILADVRVCVAGLAADAGAGQRGHRRAASQPAAAAGRRDRRSDPVSGMDRRTTISRCLARATTPSPTTSDALRADVRDRARPVALARHAAPAPRRPARHHHAGNPRIPQRAEAAHRHQGGGALARAPARASRLYRASSASTATASWSASAASAACSPRPPIRARPAPFPICGARSTTSSAAPASIRRAIPARRWSTCSRLIRATNCFRSTRTRSTSFALAILQLDERPRVRVLPRRDRFDRFVSVLVYVPRDRYDSQHPGADRRLSGHGLQGPRARLLSVLSRKARWCACISSSGATRARRRIRIAPRSTARSKRSCAAGPTVSTRRLRPGRDPGRRARAVRALPRRLPDRLPRSLSAGDGGRRYRVLSRRSRRSDPLGVELLPRRAARRRRAPASRSSATAGRSRCPSACRCWKIWASASSTSAPITSAGRARPMSGSTT